MRPFVEYYDATYSDKDYRIDNDIVRGLLQTDHRPHFLEVGSGTGNQSFLLSEWADVVAVETDGDFATLMRAKMQQHQTPIRLFEGDIGELPDTHFDGAGAFFNVINYIHGQDALAHFFKEIALRLKPSAPFVFDIWHGEAVLSDPPVATSRVKHFDNYLGVGSATQTIVPTLNTENRDVRLDYNIQIESSDGRLVPEPFIETIHMYLWLEDEIRQHLQRAGFTDITFFDGRNYPQAATAKSWTCWIVARKGTQ